MMTQVNKHKSSRSGGEPCCAGLAGLFDHRLFRALCDPSRLAILCRLAEGRCATTVSGAARCCPTDLSVVSRHLATLRDAGILQAERRGREVLYSVRCSELAATLRRIADALEACCPPGGACCEGDSTGSREVQEPPHDRC